MPCKMCTEKSTFIRHGGRQHLALRLRAPGALGLLRDGPIVLRLTLGHGGVWVDGQGRSRPLGPPQELPGHHQITVTLRV